MNNEYDINDPQLMNEPIDEKEGVSGAEFFAMPLPNDGWHSAALSFGQDKIKLDRQKGPDGQRNGKPYLLVHLAASFEEAGHKFTLFDRLTSIVMESRGISSLRAMLDVAGNPTPARSTLAELKDAVEQFIAPAPDVDVKSVWEAQAKIESDDEAQKAYAAGLTKKLKRVGDYYTVLRGQAKFPENGAGGYSPEVANPVTGETLRAQARIIAYRAAQHVAQSAPF